MRELYVQEQHGGLHCNGNSLSFLLLPCLSINTQAHSSHKHVYTSTPPLFQSALFSVWVLLSQSLPLILDCNFASVPCFFFSCFMIQNSKSSSLKTAAPPATVVFFKARNHSRCFVKEKIRSFFSPFPQNTTVHHFPWVNRACLHQQAVSSSVRTWLCTRDTPGTSRNRWWGFFRRRKANCMCLFCSWQSIHRAIGWSF